MQGVVVMLLWSLCTRFVLFVLLVSACSVSAEVLAPPGDIRLRQDIELLNDTRVLDMPSTAWPLSWGEIHTALGGVDRGGLTSVQQTAYERLFRQSRDALESGAWRLRLRASLGDRVRVIRTFAATPRESREVALSMTWVDDWWTVHLAGTLVDDARDGDRLRPDGTYLGAAVGNWLVTAGWQSRWWGPGRDGSLIMGNNHRPAPGLSVRRNVSWPFASRWLSWLGPWTLTGFAEWLDDERWVKDALLLGIRGSIRPVKGLEIGVSRTAQWCGAGRPCRWRILGGLLLGRDNRGVNVSARNEPGNQLGGIDIRWSLPGGVPVTAYLQWIGEDGRGGGEGIGSWLRQLGVEFHGRLGSLSHRTHVEVSDTQCREGGFGFSGGKPNCAYEHGIYRSGYRYRGRVMGHGMDGDGLSYSLGVTLVQSSSHVWNLSLRHMELNRRGWRQLTHSVAPRARTVSDVRILHERESRFGHFRFGAGYARMESDVSGERRSEPRLFFEWRSR